jgi:predicted nucleic acid-binding Zn ribbon protein
MPTYIFRDKNTGDQFEKVMKISELDSFRAENPHLETVIQAPMVCDPTRVGVAKKDTGFKEVLQKIHSRAPGSVLNKTSSQL